jgi:hypothetical protein
MGITGLDQLGFNVSYIPFLPVNVSLANKCYIVILDASGAKNAHMGILIDLAGMSNDTELSGLLIHAIANVGDGQVPHSADFQCHPWTGIKSELVFSYVGELCDSKYLVGNNNIQLPFYLAPPAVSELSFSLRHLYYYFRFQLVFINFSPIQRCQ